MSIYMQSTIELNGAGFVPFLEAMPQAVEFLEKTVGWRLAGAFVQETGRLSTVVDLWELQDMNHYHRGLQQLVAAPFYPQFKAVLDASVERETIVLLERAPYMR
jgi:hypothetical protein